MGGTARRRELPVVRVGGDEVEVEDDDKAEDGDEDKDDGVTRS